MSKSSTNEPKRIRRWEPPEQVDKIHCSWCGYLFMKKGAIWARPPYAPHLYHCPRCMHLAYDATILTESGNGPDDLF